MICVHVYKWRKWCCKWSHSYQNKTNHFKEWWHHDKIFLVEFEICLACVAFFPSSMLTAGMQPWIRTSCSHSSLSPPLEGSENHTSQPCMYYYTEHIQHKLVDAIRVAKVSMKNLRHCSKGEFTLPIFAVCRISKLIATCNKLQCCYMTLYLSPHTIHT